MGLTRRWPLRLFRRSLPTRNEVQAVVESVPLAELPNHVLTWAEQLARTTDPEKRALHWSKVQFGCLRLEQHLRDRKEG